MELHVLLLLLLLLLRLEEFLGPLLLLLHLRLHL